MLPIHLFIYYDDRQVNINMKVMFSPYEKNDFILEQYSSVLSEGLRLLRSCSMGDQIVEASKCVSSFLDLTIVQQYMNPSHNCVAFFLALNMVLSC